MSSKLLRHAAKRVSRSAGRFRRVIVISLALALAGTTLAVTSSALRAPAAKAACANPVACENANTQGDTPQSVWDVTPIDNPTIVGFADPFSVNVGGTINFKISSSASSYTVDVYRMGYYGGDGARKITSLTPNIPVSQKQPSCANHADTGLIDCGNWGVSASWSVPSSAVSGVYFARITRTDGTSDANLIPFVVTNNASHSDMLYMTSDETWQAYNMWGGNDFYVGTTTGDPWCCSSSLDPGRAVQLSYNRPFSTRNDADYGQDFFFAEEFPMIEFMEENGYDISYASQVDVAQPGAASMIEQHKALVNAGHSEYWDAQDRANVTSARDAGVNLAFFAANLMWWKTRWANSEFGNEPYRTLITYKESLDTAQTDPAGPATWTGEWRDTRFSPPGDASPENSLTGQLWDVNCCSYAETVSSDYSKDQIWKGTPDVSKLTSGQAYSMPDETLGYEWDSDIDNGSRPAGEIDLSKTCENDVQQKLATYREELVTGSACSSLTLYRAPSGALVFDSGTIQWSWGLNATHDTDTNNQTDQNMQQATINLFADMGIQPANIMSGLTLATQPHYTAPPTSTVTSPAAGTAVPNGNTVTVSGTATDSGGGVVAGVEVSTDGGSTWHPVTTMSAAGTSVTWSYTWAATGNGSTTIESRATDDDANTGPVSAGVSVNVGCPCTLFPASHVPATPSADDVNPGEFGVKFQSTVSGWVSGVRFYKGTGNDGTHTGSLWSASGTLLATGTFTNETASGWQTLTFASPVQISPNTTYVASYYGPDGHYSVDEEQFVSALKSPPLVGVQANYQSPTGGNGVFNPGGPGFPTQTGDSWSYDVDPIFNTTQPPSHPAVTSATPIDGASSIPTSTDPSATFSEAVVPSSATITVKSSSGTAVSGTTSFNAADTVATFTPASPLAAGTTYTVTVSGAKDSNGETMLAPYSYSFTTSQTFDNAGRCPCSIWPDTAPANVSDANDANGLELGVKFTPSNDGTVTGVRFYKVPDGSSANTGELWSSSGTLLATGTFTNESKQGWEQLTFSSPVSVTAGTTYVASYHTNSSHYAYTPGGLGSRVVDGPLTAQASGGVYAYGATTTFPSNATTSNFWTDVVYTTPTGVFLPTVADVTPGPGSNGNPRTVAPTVSFSQPVVSNGLSFTVKDPGGNTVPGSVSLSDSGSTATFTPSGQLAADTAYTVTVSGATTSSGATMGSPYSWTFTTAGTTCPCSLWSPSTQPSVASGIDNNAVNLGVQFTASSNGWVSGIRFYKGPSNTGTHVGDLWSSSGALLGQVTFTSESASGWQEADFSSPIPVTAGQTYTASYFAPNGGYSYDSSYFASNGVTNGPLTAPALGNGVYVYGGAPAAPDASYNATNYWVDPVFTQS